jgi:thermostable 8-oxoguanine DNA glycosylase
MVDAANITNYNLTDKELETTLMFWVFAAGKNGTRAAQITNQIRSFWDTISKDVSTFDWLMHYDLNETIELLKRHKTGCHNIKARTLWQLCREGLNLKNCSPEDLEKIYGIGMKTARCFIIHTRKNSPYAGLDTHMLKHLASLGFNVPKNTPSSKKLYLTIEDIVINLAKESGKTMAEFDLDIWNKYKVA